MDKAGATALIKSSTSGRRKPFFCSGHLQRFMTPRHAQSFETSRPLREFRDATWSTKILTRWLMKPSEASSLPDGRCLVNVRDVKATLHIGVAGIVTRSCVQIARRAIQIQNTHVCARKCTQARRDHVFIAIGTELIGSA